jgi:hypothetical protein
MVGQFMGPFWSEQAWFSHRPKFPFLFGCYGNKNSLFALKIQLFRQVTNLTRKLLKQRRRFCRFDILLTRETLFSLYLGSASTVREAGPGGLSSPVPQA